MIYIWRTYSGGYEWEYEWQLDFVPTGSRAIDLDRWYELDLNDQEVICCLEALEE